ncbi:hypothetical protein B296_00000184 [Ensete ventricosum]|uniref:Uncharacterized protein n=1 Tax=Ensete ventricosum TaxID=4639 RepID=A0A426ZMC2_ENSVE|nr:hypothetical protein B296_00000184 [Ensete ventricosum]
MGNIFMEDIGIAGTTLGAPGQKSDLGAGKANFKSVVKDRSIGSSFQGKGLIQKEYKLYSIALSDVLTPGFRAKSRKADLGSNTIRFLRLSHSSPGMRELRYIATPFFHESRVTN